MFTFSLKGPYTIVETITELNFRVCHDETKKTIKVHYDRLKQHKCREQTSVRINETRIQRELEEKPFAEEVDDDFIKIEVEQTNQRKGTNREKNSRMKTMRQLNHTIT